MLSSVPSAKLLSCSKASNLVLQKESSGGGGEHFWDGLQPPATLRRNEPVKKIKHFYIAGGQERAITLSNGMGAATV